VGRAERDERRDAARPGDNEAVAQIAERLLAKAEEMTPRATNAEFLDALQNWAPPLLEARGAARLVTFQDALLARRAALSASDEERLSREVERARFLVERGRREAADALWKDLSARIRSLPEGAPKLRAEADYAGYVERTRGADAAAAEWQALSKRYPWSLGLFEDRLAFLERSDRGAEARGALEATAPGAGDGRREQLLERLVRESLDARDLPRARRAVESLLASKRLDDAQRLGAFHLLARLRLQEDAAFDPLTLAAGDGRQFSAALQPDLYAQLARAADAERAWPAACNLWIEALNRRLERGWLQEAARSADRAGRSAALREFFEKQQARSPRDVRWAVAVRELRRHQDDAEGAIAMAKTATSIRPERESLWREAADLMLRADRVAEAADFLEGWNKPRPGDESVASWRGSLYARAGNPGRAFEIERAALDAFEKEAPLDKPRRDELQSRRGRAARRLLGYGLPDLAFRIALPTGDLSRLGTTGLDLDGQAELALAAGRFPAFLKAVRAEDALRAAGRVFGARSRTEDQDAARAALLDLLRPASGPSVAGLRRYWPFVQASGLERAVRLGLAERHAAATPGPWTSAAPVSFLETLGQALVEPRQEGGVTHLTFAVPDLERLWVRDLAERDRARELATLLAPRLRAALVTASDLTPLQASESPLLGWAAWLDRAGVETLARGLRDEPELRAELSRIFGKRRSWDRFWALAARQWPSAPFVPLLEDASREAWLGFWAPAPKTPDPKLAALGQVQAAVGRVVAQAPGAADDPLVVALRGPRTVGDVLDPGTRFQPAVLEAATYEAVWGARAGQGFWALETLARTLRHEPDAALLPVEFPERGHETERALLGSRLAEKQADAALALELAASRADADRAALERMLRLLVRAGRREDADRRFAEEVRRLQPRLEESGLRGLEALADELKLARPVSLLAPAIPLRPALLAYLHDNRGAEAARPFHTEDASGFRVALTARFAGRETTLDSAQVRFWLFELWARGATAFPRRAIATLGGSWVQAAPWLEAQLAADRAEALATVDALPDPARLQAFAQPRGQVDGEAYRRLLLQAALRRQDGASAAALVDGLFAELRTERALELAPVETSGSVDGEEGEAEEGFVPEHDENEDASSGDPVVARLEAWLAIFVQAHQAAAIESRIAGFLAERRLEGPVGADAWRLAWRLCADDAARAALDRELEHAWLRGDFEPEALGPIVDALSRYAAAQAPRWLARWPQGPTFEVASAQAAALARYDRPAAAALLTRARTGRGFSAAEDVRAFDQWRRFNPAPAAGDPPAWKAALPFWSGTPSASQAELLPHLAAHPTDVLAGRAVLRTLAPAAEALLRRALVPLASPALEEIGSPWSDARVVRVRLMRTLRADSLRAAGQALGEAGARELALDLDARRFPRREVDSALRDLALTLAAGPAPAAADAVVALLADRRAGELVALREEILALRAPDAPQSYRLAGGTPAPWLPRDLTFAVVSNVLAAEDSR
jgi:hypothetical protein